MCANVRTNSAVVLPDRLTRRIPPNGTRNRRIGVDCIAKVAYGSVAIASSLSLPRFALSGQLSNDRIEDRSEQKAEAGDAQHAPEDGRPQSTAHFETGAGRYDQREYAQNESERGHQDRPKTQSAGFHGGVSCRKALFLLYFLGELYNENGILAGQGDQHHKADLRENVVFHALGSHAGDGRK